MYITVEPISLYGHLKVWKLACTLSKVKAIYIYSYMQVKFCFKVIMTSPKGSWYGLQIFTIPHPGVNEIMIR